MNEFKLISIFLIFFTALAGGYYHYEQTKDLIRFVQKAAEAIETEGEVASG